MRRWLGLALTWLALSLCAQAQEPARFLLLPVQQSGDFRPLQSERIGEIMREELARITARAALLIPLQSELHGLGFPTFSTPPETAQVATLCQHYQARSVLWIDLRWLSRLHLRDDQEPAGLQLALAAHARAQRQDGQLALDEPLVCLVGAPLSARPDETALAALETELAERCLRQLTWQLATIADKTGSKARVDSWQCPYPPPGPDPDTSAYYNCKQALQGYASAVRRGDYISVDEYRREALAAWRQLPALSQTRLESEFPGISDWFAGQTVDGGQTWRPGYRLPWESKP